MNQNVYQNGQSHKSKGEYIFEAHKHLGMSLTERLLEQLYSKTTASMTCTLASYQKTLSGGKDVISKPCINMFSINANAYGYQQWLMKLIQNQTSYLKLLVLRKKEDLDNFIKKLTQSSMGNFAQNVNG